MSEPKLDSYSKEELIHIVDIYNLSVDMETLRKKKSEILKALKDVPKKQLSKLPEKKEIKTAIKDNKSDDSNLLQQVKEFSDYRKKNKKAVKEMTPAEKKVYNRLAKRSSLAKRKNKKNIVV